MSGLFITVEGGEGAGKSTFLQGFLPKLKELVSEDINILLTREPGSSSIGPKVRELLLADGGLPLTPETEALLFAADRAQHMSEKIEPILSAGGIVVCDRFLDSSYAYQGVGRGLGEFILDISIWAIKGRMPDLTILLDIDPEEGIKRKHDQQELNRMELESIEFHKMVRESFLDLAKKNISRFIVIDATLPKNDIVEIALDKVKSLI